MERNDKINICRLCLYRGECLINIFELNGRHGYVASEVITDLLQLTVTKSDGYPHYACYQCLDKLTDFKIFKDQCINSKITYDGEFCAEDGQYYRDPVTCRPIKSEPEDPEFQDDDCGVEIPPVKVEVNEAEIDSGNPQVGTFDEDVQLDDNARDPAGIGSRNATGGPSARGRKTRRRTAEKHQESRGYQEGHMCQECGTEFQDEEGLWEHLKMHDAETHFLAADDDMSAMRGHYLARRQSANGSDDRTPSCDICGKTFSDKGCLRRHKKLHTGEKPYVCRTCGKRFNRKSILNVHLRSHTGEKPYTCTECGKKFAHKGNLDTHFRLHSGLKPFECPQCYKRFTRKADLVLHRNLHEKEKRFKCDVCCKGYNVKKRLVKHLLLHADKVP